MKLREISELLNATVRCGEDRLDEEHETAFASDLMSDVLTLGDYNPVILTGLCNMQTIRTCEMGNLDIIVLWEISVQSILMHVDCGGKTVGETY